MELRQAARAPDVLGAETLLPLRGLAAYADATGDGPARTAAGAGTEVLLGGLRGLAEARPAVSAHLPAD